MQVQPTADIVDQYGDRALVCDVPFVQYGGVKQFAGRIATISCDDDLLLVSQRVCLPGNGHVLVVDAKGSLRAAIAGDGIANHAIENGWAGLVIWGAIRDVDLLRNVPIGLSALGSVPRAASKTGDGCEDVPLEFAGVTFQPGAYVFSDLDGIVVIRDIDDRLA